MKNKKEKKQEEAVTAEEALEDREADGGCMGLSENISDHILCCICNEQTGVYQCRDSVGIYAEYDYERRPGAGKPSGIYQR